MQIMRGICGFIQASLQWCKYFTDVLQKEGFELNPYDQCVANNITNGEQRTVSWYVDDIVMSHKDINVLKQVLGKIWTSFGEMNLATGNIHSFLGMNITIRKDKKIKKDIRDQIKETIDLFK